MLPYPFLCFFLLLPRPPTSTLFPYTTLFRSARAKKLGAECVQGVDDKLRVLQQHAKALSVELAATAYVGNEDRKSTRLNSSHEWISYAVFCLKKKKKKKTWHGQRKKQETLRQ